MTVSTFQYFLFYFFQKIKRVYFLGLWGKEFIFLIVLLILNFTQSFAQFNINNGLTFTSSANNPFDVSGQETILTGITFSNDGMRMFITGASGSKVTQYDLGTAFDITTASFTASANNPYIAASTDPRGVEFSNDGMQMFIVSYIDNNVYQYDLGTAFDITTASFTASANNPFDTSPQETLPQAIAFSNDGMRMFTTGTGGGAEINQYDLGTAFDITTATFTPSPNNPRPIGMQESSPLGLSFSNDGMRMFTTGTGGGAEINQYDLGTAFDITTTTFTPSANNPFSISAQDATPSEITFSNNGLRLFVTGASGSEVNQYNLSASTPTTQASNINFGLISDTQATINWTNGNGTERIVVVEPGTDPVATPMDNASYIANTDFTAVFSSTLGDDSKVVAFNNDATPSGSVIVTNLTAGTVYNVKAYEANQSGLFVNYNTDDASNNPQTFATEPNTQASAVSISSITGTSATISWTQGNATNNHLVIIKSASAVNQSPTDRVSYTANTTFGSGTDLGSGNYIIFSGNGNSVNVSGLTSGTDYYVQVFEYIGSAGIENYNLVSAPTTNFTTATPATPEINVQVNATDIASGGNVPLGTVDVGTTDTRTVVIQNTGTSDLLVSNITLGTGTVYTLSSLPSFPLGIVAGGSSTFTLNFTPSSAITFTDVLTITSSDGDEGTYTINLSGIGNTVASVPIIEVLEGAIPITSSTLIDFGTVTWGSNSANRTFTIQNTGTGNLQLLPSEPIRMTGTEGHFTITQQPTVTTIVPGGSTTFSVQFTPQSADLETESILIYSNVDGFVNPKTITLRGQGLREILSNPNPFNAVALSDKVVGLTWGDISNEEGYVLSKSLNGSNFLILDVLNADVTNYLDNTLAPNQTVYYKIQAVSERGESAEVFSGAVTTKNPPRAPTNLFANTLSQNEIILTWEDESDNEIGFAIERANNSSDGFTEVTTVGVNITSYTDGGLDANTNYFYRVRALNPTEGNSTYSNISGARTSNVPLPPENLTLNLDGNNDVVLNWQDNSSNEDLFRVERFNSLEETGNFVEIARLPAESTSFTDTTTTPNQIYIYRLRASNADGISVASTTASIETPIDPNVDKPTIIPQELRAEPISESEIALAWRPVTNGGRTNRNTNSFARIEVATNPGGPFVEVAQITITKNRFQLTGLAKDVVYYFRIRYANDGGNSAYSESASAKPECRLLASVSDDKEDLITSVCDGKSALLILKTNVIEATYQWTRDGLTLSNSNQPFYYATENGKYNCIITAGQCVETALVPVVVTLNEAISVSITQRDNLLEADLNSATTYQWYKEEEAIEGANSFQYTPNEDGLYYVVVTQNGCSATSNFIFYTTTGVDETISDEIVVYPNPTAEYLELSWENDYLGEYTLSLYDVMGKQYRLKSDIKNTLLLQEQINLSSFESGVYLLELKGKDFQAIKKIIKK